jgi:hypothetical protein
VPELLAHLELGLAGEGLQANQQTGPLPGRPAGQ